MKRIVIILCIALMSIACFPLKAQTSDNNPESNKENTKDSKKKKQKKERTLALWGHVKNSFTKVGIPNTLITLMDADSTVIDTFRVRTYGGNTYKLGTNYRYMIPAVPQKYIILAQHPEYRDCYVNFEIKHVARNTYFDAPHHLMLRKEPGADLEQMLDQVEVKASKVKIAYKGDTVVYNADAFNVPNGSMLDELIRQLPGVELKDNGEILVNGRKVDYLTLNGKDFFKGKNKVMLDNLPYYTVENIEVYDKRTERSEYLGRDTEQKEYVMDVKLKKEYSEGYIANAEVGGGTEERYQMRGFGLRYTDNSRLSVYVNKNNINENRRPGSNGEWTPSNSPEGTTDQLTGGITLNIDDKEKRYSNNLQAEFGRQKSMNESRSATEYFQSNGANTFQRNITKSKGDYIAGGIYNKFTLRKPILFTQTTSLVYNDIEYNQQERQATFDSDPAKYGNTVDLLDSIFSSTLPAGLQSISVNRLNSKGLSRQHLFRLQFHNQLTKKFAWGDDIWFRFNLNHSTQSSRNFTQRRYDFFRNNTPAEDMNRYTQNPTKKYDYEAKTEYTLHWLNNWNLAINCGFHQSYTGSASNHYLLNKLEGWDTGNGHMLGTYPSTRDSMLMAIDAQNTFHYTFLERDKFVGIRPHFNREWDDKYLYLCLDSWVTFKDQRMNYHSKQLNDRIKRDYTFLSSYLMLQYTTHKGDRRYHLYLQTFRYAPDILNTTNTYFDTDPLATTSGNPNLKSRGHHHFEMSYQIRKKEKEQNLSFNLYANVNENSFTNTYTYNATTGAYHYRPENVNGNWDASARVNFNRAIDKKRYWRWNTSTNVNYIHSVDLEGVVINDAADTHRYKRSTVNSTIVSENLGLTYQQGKLTLGANGQINWRNSHSDQENIETMNVFDFNYGLTCQYELPWQIHLGTDLKMFSRRGYSEPSMNTNDLVWNATLSRTFLKGRLTTRFTGFDLLGQLSRTFYSINAQMRNERWLSTITSYGMIHIAYKFNMQPPKR